MLFWIASFAAFSQTVTIGTGTSVQRYPLSSYYGYERSASIYTSAEVATSGIVTTLGWYATTAKVAKPIKIYLKEVTSTTLTASTWNDITTGATLVYDGSSGAINANAYHTISLQSSFNYTGGSNNLLVLVETNHGGSGNGTDGNSGWIRYSTASSAHQYWQVDTNPPTTNGTVTSNRPNIQISIPKVQSFISATSIQSVTSPIIKGNTNQEIIRIEVSMDGSLSPMTVNAIELTTDGSTSPADIGNAKVWYTGNSSTFATTSQFGSTAVSPNGTFSVTGTQSLNHGINYFWLTYDLSASATAGNVVDAGFTSITINNLQREPLVDAPAGNRQIKAPLVGVYTIDQTGAGSRNFTSFTSAVNELNTVGIGGKVRFEVALGQTFNENVPVITATGTATDTIGFIKAAGAGNNPVITPSGTTGTTDAGIVISGGDYITFNGIDITSTGTAVEYGYLIRNASATNGAIYNTIRDCKITLNRASTSTSIGVVQSSSTSFGSAVTPTDLTGTNQNNKYLNLVVESANNGILLVGGSGSIPDASNQVYNCTVGGATAGNLGYSTGTTVGYGIKATLQNNVKIYNNTVRNLSTYNSQADGIFLDQGKGVCQIYNNKVYGIRNGAGTGTGTGVASGLRINLYTTDNGHSSRVYNNFVYNISHGFSGTAVATRRIMGIYVQSNGSGSGNTHNIDFNSIKIDGSGSLNQSSTCIEIGTASGAVMKVRNNIFANVTGAQSGVSKHFAWSSTSATSIGPAGSDSDNNFLYIANTTNGYPGQGGGTDYATLGLWSAAMGGKDANSKASDPKFSASELFIDAAQPTEVEGGASYFSGADEITWVTTDIDGNPRFGKTGYTGTGSAADIGADEGEFLPTDVTAPGIAYTVLGNTNLLTNRTLTVTITDASGVASGANSPRLYYRKSTESSYQFDANPTISGDDYTFTIDYSKLTGGAVNAGEIIHYYVAAQDINGNMRSNPALATGINPPGTTPTGNPNAYTILTTFNGTYYVGVTPHVPAASFATITEAMNALSAGVVAGNVTFELIDTDYSANETFPILITEPNGAGAGISIKLKPEAGVNATISGSSSTAIFRLFRVSNFTIDGSNNGTSSRNLTIRNTSTASSTAVVFISSNGTGAG
ncbi:MAG: hypothetical protein LPK21_12315, partial [Hymenobacteraceae bacterium]|nr:hypothetical protein [Hymenobacteraceae bacterium]MDX5513047.1 hypothetical protein [Hymenobacteraceae bacterium]